MLFEGSAVLPTIAERHGASSVGDVNFVDVIDSSQSRSNRNPLVMCFFRMKAQGICTILDVAHANASGAGSTTMVNEPRVGTTSTESSLNLTCQFPRKSPSSDVSFEVKS